MSALPSLVQNTPSMAIPPVDLLGDAPVRSRAGRSPANGPLRAVRAIRPPTMTEARAQEMQTAQSILKDALQAHPHDLWGQLGYFFASFRIPAARGRARSASNKTQDKYYETLSVFFQTLQRDNIRLRNLSEVNTKHLVACVRAWEDQGLSASTLANRFTCSRRFMHWVGKGGGIPELKQILKDPNRAVREYSATAPKDWENNGLIPQEVFKAIEQHCAVTAMHLRLQDAFGLRATEAICLKPRESDMGELLLVNRGTKGGRGRAVPIKTELQREVLEAAKAMASNRTGLLGRYGHNLPKAQAHYYYILGVHGITRKASGVTGHGLRHGYVGARYEELTGFKPPVAGGAKPDAETDLAARRALSLETGHTRPEITTAYTGSVAHMQTASRRRLEGLLSRLGSDCFSTPYLALKNRLAGEGRRLEVHLLGADAEGKAAGPAAALLLGVRVLSADLGHQHKVGEFDATVGQVIQELTPVARAATDRMAIITNLDHISADMPRCEVLF